MTELFSKEDHKTNSVNPKIKDSQVESLDSNAESVDPKVEFFDPPLDPAVNNFTISSIINREIDWDKVRIEIFSCKYDSHCRCFEYKKYTNISVTDFQES